MIKIIIKYLFISFLFISLQNAQIIQDAKNIANKTVLSKEIVKGLTYKKIINREDSLSANVLEINLKENNFYIDAIKAEDRMKAREKTSSMLKRFNEPNRKVVAGVNADFFNMHTGENENNLVINGTIAKGLNITDSPYDSFNNNHSQFAITFDNKPAIERFGFVGSVFYKNKSLMIKRINSDADSNSITLYNKYQGQTTPSSRNNWSIEEFEIVPINQIGDTVVCVKSQKINRHGNNIIPQTGFILSINNSMIKTFDEIFEKDDTLKLQLDFMPHVNNLKTLVGGWPRIIKDGKNIAPLADSLEGTFYRFAGEKHPRTGVGFSKDSTIIYLVTVDGRQESMSGMSLTEFADFMLSLGAYQALNLDGGGSTTMIVNGKVVNSPSDSDGERKVADCLVVSIRK